jgi:hypothetical protein
VTQDLTAQDVDALALAALPSQHEDAATFRALVDALADRLQTVDDALIEIQTQRDIAEMDGAQLDQLGRWLGEPRPGGAYPDGVSDALYRERLRAAGLRNASRGTHDDVQSVVDALIGANLSLSLLTDTPPAAFRLEIVVSSALSSAQATALGLFVRSAKAAGVGATILHGEGPLFGYGSASYIGGYGSGKWASVA